MGNSGEIPEKQEHPSQAGPIETLVGSVLQRCRVHIYLVQEWPGIVCIVTTPGRVAKAEH
jgi:hypothetical protein